MGGQAPLTRLRRRFPAAGSRGPAIVLAALTLFAVALRAHGLGFGLPAVFNPDETAIMSRALAFATGDLNPHNFLYPTFYFYVLFLWVGAYFGLAWVAGAVPSVAAFQTRFFTDPTGIYLAGRWLGVTAGALTVLVVWYWTKRLWNGRAALAAALFIAVAPIHVRDSHYVKHDVPVTLAIVVAVLLASAIPPAGDSTTSRRRRIAAAAAAAGLACSTHYYAVFLAVPLVLAVALTGRHVRRTIADLALAGAVATVAFFALSPFLLVEPGTAIRDIVANRQIVLDRAVAGQAGLFGHLGTYAAMLWRDAIGWPVVVLGLAGAAAVLKRAPKTALVLVSFPVVFFLFISNAVPATRYLNPVLPFVAVLAGIGTAELTGKRWKGPAAAAVLAIVAAAPGAAVSVATGFFFDREDTRTLAQRYIEREIPAGSSIAIQPYSVPLIQSRESLVESLRAHLGDERRASRKFQIRLGLDPYPAPAYRLVFIGDGGLDVDKIYVGYGAFDHDRGLAALRSLGVTYVVVKRYNTDDPGSLRLIEALAAEARLVARFSPYRPDAGPGETAAAAPFLHNTDARMSGALERPGPIIEVWSIPASGA